VCVRVRETENGRERGEDLRVGADRQVFREGLDHCRVPARHLLPFLGQFDQTVGQLDQQPMSFK
jgi:hypothetical protein